VGFGRETALPFVLVHEDYFCPGAAKAAQIRNVGDNLGGKHPLRQHLARMGASRSATIPSQ
jgi:hypothetical protein